MLTLITQQVVILLSVLSRVKKSRDNSCNYIILIVQLLIFVNSHKLELEIIGINHIVNGLLSNFQQT